MNRWAYFLYAGVLWLAALPGLVLLLWRYRGRASGGLRQRLGRWDVRIPDGTKVLWIHAASLGEIKAITPLVEAVKKKWPRACVVLSTTTSSGLEYARAAGLYQTVSLAPLDFNFCVERVVSILRPAVLVLVESELWPHLLKAVKALGAPVLVVNGRLSSESTARYGRLGPLKNLFFEPVDHFGVRGPEDAERLRRLGIPGRKITVTGNLKYDQPMGGASEKNGFLSLKKSCGWNPQDPVWMAGSTREGEEQLLTRVFQSARKKYPRLRWILAPRHLERISGITEGLTQSGVSWSLYTQPSVCDCLVLDQLGVLSGLYGAADIVFVGGSLVPLGGQNLLEPALLKKPILMGPHMDNFSESARLLRAADGAWEVASESELLNRLEEWLADPQKASVIGKKAYDAAITQRGAVEKTLKLISGYLHE